LGWSDERIDAAGNVSADGHDHRRGSWLLVAGVALISLAIWPPLPIAGAQISDVIGGLGAVLVIVRTRRVPPLPASVAGVAYVVAATASTLLAGGSLVRLCGYAWLVVLAWAVYNEPRHVRRALLMAAVIGALTGLVGAALYYAGHATPLLNHAGDLVPGNYPRVRGTMLRANALAGLCAVGLLLLGDAPRRWRVATGIVLGLALVFTFSRTWIALATALGVMRLSHRRVAAVILLVASVATMLAVSWLNLRLDPMRPWAISIAAGPGTRLIHLHDALTTIAAHPLGMGAGRAATPSGWDAHFTLANIAAVIGIPAAISFVAIVATAFRECRDRTILAVLLLFCIDALARDIEDQRALWIVIGLALASRVRPQDRPATERSRALSP
jgi:hypothetical protein